MKKHIKGLIALFSALTALTATAYAQTGDVAGEALHTDIVAYINNYALPSYAANGQSVIIAEDLINFGFEVNWDNDTRSLTITRNPSAQVRTMNVHKSDIPGTKFSDVYETDIKVYANGVQLTSYALNGYTMIPIEQLDMFGNINWSQEERAIKLWVDDLQSLPAPQEISATPFELININGETISVFPKDYYSYVNSGWYTFDTFVIAWANQLAQTKGYIEAIEYLEAKMLEGSFIVTQQHQDALENLYSALYNQYQVPILVKDNYITYDDRIPYETYITFWNISGKDIEYFEIDFSCHNSFGELDTSYFSGICEDYYVNNAQFKKNTIEEWSWSLDGFPRTSNIRNITVTRVAFEDGTIWSRE